MATLIPINLFEIYSKLIDIPLEYVDLILKEINSKYSDTHMILNGELVYIVAFKEKSIQFKSVDFSIVKAISDVTSLLPYIPEVGIYICKSERTLFLGRDCKKQWKKSFTWENFKLSVIGSSQVCTSTIFDVFNGTKVDFIVIKNEIFYHHLKIGKRINGEWEIHPAWINEINKDTINAKNFQ